MEKVGVWSLTLLYTIVVLLLLLTPGSELPPIGVPLSWLHVPMFFLMSYLLFNSLTVGMPEQEQKDRHLMVVAYLVTILYSIIIEVAQQYVPGRYTSYNDVTLNIIGAALVVFSREINTILDISADFLGVIDKEEG